MTQLQGFIELRTLPGLIETGVAETMRAAAQPARFPHLQDFDDLRQRVADNIVSLAFRRYLTEQNIPHQTLESMQFTQPDTLDIGFGGRRCLPIAQMICQREVISEIHRHPTQLAQGEIILPEGTTHASYRDVDIYLFIYLTALVTRSRDDIEKAIVAGEPVYLAARLPEAWSAPAKWAPLDPLAIKTDISQPLPLTLHGQDHQRAYLKQAQTLPPRQRLATNAGFYTLGAVSTPNIPTGPLGIHSKGLDDTVLVNPYQWGNLWVYALRMYLAGYTTQAEFNRQAESVELAQTTALNPCLKDGVVQRLPVSALRPAQDLFVRAANWARQKGER